MLLLSEISNRTIRLFLLGFFILTGSWNLFAQPNFKRVCVSPDQNDLILHWERASDPCNKFQQIEIFGRPNNATAFSSIAIITNPAQVNYTHSGAFALSKTWSYQLVYNFLCDDMPYTSPILGVDIFQPPTSIFDSVSYDPSSGGIIMGWSQNTAADLYGYYIWESENGNNFKFDSTYTALFYLDTRLDPNAKQLEYNLTAFDSCGMQSFINPIPQAAPFLTGTTANCAREITLNWLPYKGRGNSYFQVYLSLDGQDYFIDTLLPGAVNTYTFTIESNQTVNAFVRATLDNGLLPEVIRFNSNHLTTSA